MLRLSPVTPEDCHVMATDMRQEDKEEWAAGGIIDIRHHMWAGIENYGSVNYTVRHEGRPLVIFGAHPYGINAALVWLVATPEATKHVLALHRLAPEVLAQWDIYWATLHAHSWEHNPLHHKWLEWLGFELTWPVPVRGFLDYQRKRPCAPPS
jgi:hypothetical protein